MDNMTPEFEEIYGNRRKTIERLKERNKKFAELTRVEFTTRLFFAAKLRNSFVLAETEVFSISKIPMISLVLTK